MLGAFLHAIHPMKTYGTTARPYGQAQMGVNTLANGKMIRGTAKEP
ncbi:MAG: hypothetical protein CFH35_00231 [Alphaproteobacteria bacterium MarineAlpha9_Bin5]|jgi:hypothetical protein|nr:MAG: hypothetical protein CFH36_00293 [Alphaproteobacteria bacterium MarineAlpha9_Bin6]PPR39966.1 MAG: hypothetical protein CFH35_00231 [Alphaproteobacteria bacterium MarineAlpha9_Bin5]